MFIVAAGTDADPHQEQSRGPTHEHVPWIRITEFYGAMPQSKIRVKETEVSPWVKNGVTWVEWARCQRNHSIPGIGKPRSGSLA